MSNAIHTDPTRRHDFVLLFDVKDGNPNGDPDAGNLPRVDPETMEGLVTDVSIKRKVRDWMDARHGEDENFKIYVQTRGIALNDMHQRAYTALSIKSTGSKQKREDVERLRAWMCENFYDIRMFGAVMTTGVNCGQVRGPLQMKFARSIDPVIPLDSAITRVAITRPEDAAIVEGDEQAQSGKGKTTEMGRKAFVPYGLYRTHGFFTPQFAAKTGITEKDLSLFWEALEWMWESHRTSSSGEVACRGLYVFTHENGLGNAHAHQLFDRILVKGKKDIESPRDFSHYDVTVEDPPDGVDLTRLVD